MTENNAAILSAIKRLQVARAALKEVQVPYNAALKERHDARAELERLHAPKPRTDFPLCG